MSLKWVFGFFFVLLIAQNASAAVAITMSCEQAEKFLKDVAYTCDDEGVDCSRGECVNLANCRYTKGFEGFSINFAYLTSCNLE